MADRSTPYTLFALLSALASVGGSIYLTLGLGLIACPICLYQRTFAIAVMGILIFGVATRARGSGQVNLFAFLPALAGGFIAAFHTYLDMTQAWICPAGLFGIGSTAQQSLASFALILGCLLPGLVVDVRKQAVASASVTWSVLAAGVLAYLCIVSAPEPTLPPVEQRSLICYPPIDVRQPGS